MKKERKYATHIEIESRLKELNISKLLKKLENFAKFNLYDHHENRAFDVVNQAFDKLLTQERKWYNGDSIEKTLFGAVRSLCNNENKKLARKWKTDVVEIEIEDICDTIVLDQLEELKIKELKQIAIQTLQDHDPPPDYLEELIFECWIEGLTKQQEITEYLEKDIVEIRKGVKRLKRKLGSIQDKFLKMGYEKK